MTTSKRLLPTLLGLTGMLLVACGGGGSGTGSPVSGGAGGGTDGTGAAAYFSQGAITRGSVILNGVRFDDTAAAVRIDDRAGTSAELADGMVVKLRGRLNADGTTGTAERVEVENEVRGAVTAVSAESQPASFVVVGQTVLVDGATVYGGLAGVGAITPGTRVQVYGQRDAGGAIRASRVEVTRNDSDELRGSVSNLASNTFSLGNVTVSFTGAAISPAGAGLSNGQPVEVRGVFNAVARQFVATAVDREDLEDQSVQPSAGQKLEVEGFVAQFDGAASSFLVGTLAVRYSGATRFEGGSAADLADNVKVEAEGTINAAGVLVAAKIEFRQSRVIVQGLVTAVSTAPRRLTVLGLPVSIDDLTEVRAIDVTGRDSTRLADVAAGADRVEVRGRLDAAGAIVAEEVRETDDRDDELRGQVTAKNEPAATLRVLGVDVSLAGAEFRGSDGASIGAAAFFAAVTPASSTARGTEVKIKGTFAGGTLIAEEAELED